ncbi:hypothetical protein QBC38DRAFT_538284 [Podospora fimiseda]|uniref:C2 domain-containing protein n=1 Tax=Podospora fimiseda TaxID=252190 RepID=A0AAN7BK70_9PEZI|nr:hypothetical protein QBC38DRAFT_538284 [Podospora fimiseda]
MMAARAKPLPMGVHTAGIFSDSTVDGPEIGKLVVIIDRAKNLPNRKTIGKQDPYCAARLGKEAQKTRTDVRGGQTPRWDQELRFTVHDSTDYYQLKLSVFNDDKKTELIGESWIDLKPIIVQGGGQSDQWHNLLCRGKYAGEVRIEITFYDTRPKPDRQQVRPKTQPQHQAQIQQLHESEPISTNMAGPRAMPKRRPLPADPMISTKIPSPPGSHSPVPGQEQLEAPPPQAQQNSPGSYTPSHSPLQQFEFNNAPPPPPSSRYHQQPPPEPYSRHDPNMDYDAPPRRPEPPAQQYRAPEWPDKYAIHPDDRQYSHSPQYQQPAYDRFDSRPRESFSAPVPQGNLEEDRPPPPPVHRSRAGSNPVLTNQYQIAPPTMRQNVLRNEAHRQSGQAASPSAYPGRPTYKASDSAPAVIAGSQYSNMEQQPQPPRHYSYDVGYSQSHRHHQATVEDVPESPESVDSAKRRSIGRPPRESQTQFEQYDTPFEPEYGSTNDSPAPLNIAGRRPSNTGPSSSRYSTSPGLQDNNVGPGVSRYSTSPGVQDDGSPPVPPTHFSTSPGMQDHLGHQREKSGSYRPSPVEAPPRAPSDYSSSSNYGRHSEPILSSYSSQQEQRALTYRNEFEDSPSYSAPPPPVPASLVPGMSQELVRVGERRYTQQAQIEPASRGRTMGDASRRYDYDDPQASYNPAPPAHAGRSPGTYTTNGPSTSSVNVVIRQRNYSPNPPPARDPSPNPPMHSQYGSRRDPSPNPYAGLRDPSPNPPIHQQHTIRRKSVSPRPPSSDSRAISSIPFGPDSYDSLNPNVSAGAIKDSTTSRPDYNEATGKIITHDGNEVDPSDHLPMESWAPEPEPKNNALSTSPAARAGLSNSEPRQPLRITGVPRPSSYVEPDRVDSSPTPLSSSLRNRLQKKAPYRQSMSAVSSAMPPMMSGANGPGPGRRNSNVGMDSSPLAPLPSHHDNFTPPRQLPRASTFDYGAGENYHPSRPAANGMPPIPAKVPLALPPPPGHGNMSGALQLHSSSAARRHGLDEYDNYHHDSRGDSWGGDGRELSLEEELRSIDIGTGRSSRRNYGQQQLQYGGYQG